jgi:hypothetical protein
LANGGVNALAAARRGKKKETGASLRFIKRVYRYGYYEREHKEMC